MTINEKNNPSGSIVTDSHVAEAIRFERRREKHAARAPKAGENWFRVLRGSSKVLVTAPHATRSMRNGKLRHADGGTGWLAYMLHRLAGATTVMTTRISPSDPNFYDDNAFKRETRRLLDECEPAVVLDLHAAKSTRPFDVDFGTMHGRSLLGQIKLVTHLQVALARSGVDRFSENFFPAAKHDTVTKWVSAAGIPCIQIEANGRWLSIDSAPDRASRSARFLQGMVNFVGTVNSLDTPTPSSGSRL